MHLLKASQKAAVPFVTLTGLELLQYHCYDL